MSVVSMLKSEAKIFNIIEMLIGNLEVSIEKFANCRSSDELERASSVADAFRLATDSALTLANLRQSIYNKALDDLVFKQRKEKKLAQERIAKLEEGNEPKDEHPWDKLGYFPMPR